MTIVQLVNVDLLKREKFGTERYGKPVDVTDDIDWLQMAYEEAMDQVIYLKAAIERRRIERSEGREE